jgi:hypothetical protein
MPQEIKIEIAHGNLTFSFHTDEKGTNIDSMVGTIKRILSTKANILGSVSGQGPTRTGKASTRKQPEKIAKLTGKAETSVIRRKLEQGPMTKGYFKTARSTGEVVAELKKETGIQFTSRKVSQALGIFFKKKELARVGPKGNYRYVQE